MGKDSVPFQIQTPVPRRVFAIVQRGAEPAHWQKLPLTCERANLNRGRVKRQQFLKMFFCDAGGPTNFFPEGRSPLPKIWGGLARPDDHPCGVGK